MKLNLELQYFEDCPNYKKMNDNLNDAIKSLEDKIAIKKVLVEDAATAIKVSFRCLSTLLINGEDIEGIPAPIEPNLSCRFYSNGIPKADEIRKMIFQKMRKEN